MTITSTSFNGSRCVLRASDPEGTTSTTSSSVGSAFRKRSRRARASLTATGSASAWDWMVLKALVRFMRSRFRRRRTYAMYVAFKPDRTALKLDLLVRVEIRRQPPVRTAWPLRGHRRAARPSSSRTAALTERSREFEESVVPHLPGLGVGYCFRVKAVISGWPSLTFASDDLRERRSAREPNAHRKGVWFRTRRCMVTRGHRARPRAASCSRTRRSPGVICDSSSALKPRRL